MTRCHTISFCIEKFSSTFFKRWKSKDCQSPIHDPSLPLPEGDANPLPLPPDVALYSYHKA